ncbi:MAG: bifunctional diguanylate cyclase/phosphodiesterase [Rhizobiales bacterium]|nr:bifunctional diguanylate cyclase/phosphodiesterase [Hyphomicrobiales bacterium]MBA68783.1 bifunctional diguanylate cyclase/phosphodiesterase [Hyphomicrobiales bacterium]
MPSTYPTPESEENRLEVLAEYRLMDTPPESDFDRIAQLATRMFDVPVALVSLIASDRQFFKARVGLDICETSRDISFCTHAIMQDEILFVPDASKDSRFYKNPLVLGPPNIRFYAGMPLMAPSGEKLGTLCLIDSKPRNAFNDAERRNLRDLAALVMDRMEIRRLEQIRGISQARFENITATSPDAIICFDSQGEVTFWNGAADKLFGYGAEQIVGQPVEMVIPRSWRHDFQTELENLQNGKSFELADRTIELSGMRKDGSIFPAEFSLSTWQEGTAFGVGAIVRDVTERRLNEERLFRLASTDILTGLPNRGAWQDCLDSTLAADVPAAVLIVDLDGFKEVNDKFGHASGDDALKMIADRLKVACSSAFMVARLGGDEFVVLLPESDEEAVLAAASDIVSAISDSYEFNGRTLEIGACVGIAMAPVDGTDAEGLLKSADLALYKAKAEGRNRVEIFKPFMREAVVARRAFEDELRHAIEAGQFELYYQPQFSTHDRRLTGAEALMRWNHPERGVLSPAAFIDVLSKKPSAARVGEWTLRTVCRQAAEWRKMMPNLRLGVNLFEAQFQSGRLLASVQEALEDFRLPPEALELEIVENTILHDDSHTLQLLRDLRALGVGLAFDDYGTGFAALSLLKKYPVSRLKIDRSFIRDANNDFGDAAVVRAILYLGNAFGLEVIAEGVETEAQLQFLNENGCREVQGYLFGKPVRVSEFEELFIDPELSTMSDTLRGMHERMARSSERNVAARKVAG